MSDKKSGAADSQSWWIFRGIGEENPKNELNELVKKNLKPEDAPPWRRFGEGVGRRRGVAVFEVEPREIERVNAALLLRRPLLITGPPGTGKTSLTYAVAHELGLEPVLRWSITSRTRLRDGLYHYDAVARLQDTPRFSQGDCGGRGARREHGRIPGLDRAPERKPPIDDYVKLGPLGTAFAGFQDEEKRPYPRVLLIDEIDKADIDLPNDLLHIFEEGYFEIDELKRQKDPMHYVEPWDGGERVRVANGRVQCRTFPLVIMTSNAEREFPPAFLRRCLPLEMRRPDKNKLGRIVEARLKREDEKLYREHAQRIDEIISAFVEHGKKKDLATDQLLHAVFLVMQNIDPVEGVRPLDPETDRDTLIEALWKSLRDEHG